MFERAASIYDMGCGEGVLVNEYRERGYQITGMDLNYSSQYIVQTKFSRNRVSPIESADMMMCTRRDRTFPIFSDQEKAITEFARILKAGRQSALISVPNLAHLASRISFFLPANWCAPQALTAIPATVPSGEYVKMFEKHFRIQSAKESFQLFLMISVLTVIMPSNVIWLAQDFTTVWRLSQLVFPQRRSYSKNRRVHAESDENSVDQ